MYTVPFLGAAVLIFISAAALTAYAIKKCSHSPTRVAAVIIALASLIATMPAVFRSLGGAESSAVVAPPTASPAPVTEEVR